MIWNREQGLREVFNLYAFFSKLSGLLRERHLYWKRLDRKIKKNGTSFLLKLARHVFSFFFGIFFREKHWLIWIFLVCHSVRGLCSRLKVVDAEVCFEKKNFAIPSLSLSSDTFIFLLAQIEYHVDSEGERLMINGMLQRQL